MYDVIIIGAGVSGISCAIATNKNYKTLLIDKNSVIGKKLAITGKGRCNITNSNYGEYFLENIYNYKFMHSAFSKFDNFTLMELMSSYNVELAVEDNGRMFPITNKSNTVIEALQKNLKHVDLKLNEEVIEIKMQDENFIVNTTNTSYETKKLVIATGGLSYPETGSDGFGLKFAKTIGHKVTKLIASEAPLYSNDQICIDLQGVTLSNVALKYDNKSYLGYNLLFTHFGLSGPLAMRQCFSIIKNGIKEIYIDFMPSYNNEQLKEGFLEFGVINTLTNTLTKSAAVYLSKELEGTEFAKLSKKHRDEYVHKIKNYKIEISKYADVSKGFTTAGGIELKQIDNKSFESKIVDNLFFVGELLDVHAHTGGYNISTFFSMGYVCGSNL